MRTAHSTIPLGLDAGGHDSMELKILWRATSVRVRPPPPAHLQTVGVDGRGRMLRWHRLFAKSKREIPEMKKTGFCVLMAACVLLLASCSSLNESAQNVQYSTKCEAPKDCKEIG